MRTQAILTVAAAALVLGAPAPARAEPAKGAGAEAVRQVETAYRVAEWGREQGDARALLVAAQMLESANVRTVDDSGGDADRIDRDTPAPETAEPAVRARKPMRPAAPPPPPAAPVATGDTKRPPRETTVQSLLDEAEALSKGDRGIRASIAARRQSASKGVTASSFGPGPVRRTRQIPARSVWSFDLVARGGEALRLAAIGDGDTDVDVEIRDSSGRIVCEDRTAGHYAACSFVPPFEGRYTARIFNRGQFWTLTTLVSN